jgi:heme/copper-type cytochrome/quinol oxidase subunit 2
MPLHGTWQVTGDGGPDIPVVPAVAAVMAVAIAGWLATIVLILAVIFAVLAVLLVGAAVWMRRRYPDYSASVAEQAAALRADMAKPAVVEHHHYVHTLPGETAGEASWAPLVRGTVEHKED